MLPSFSIFSSFLYLFFVPVGGGVHGIASFTFQLTASLQSILAS